MTARTYVESFQLKNPDKIVIEHYSKLSEHTDTIVSKNTREITDKIKISEITTLLNQLPDEGQIMIKMGDVPLTKVNFFYGTDTVFFEFYNKKLKAPDTSFYDSTAQQESKLYLLLD